MKSAALPLVLAVYAALLVPSGSLGQLFSAAGVQPDQLAAPAAPSARVVPAAHKSVGRDPIYYQCTGIRLDSGMQLGFGFSLDVFAAKLQACGQCTSGGHRCAYSCTMQQGRDRYPWPGGNCN